MFLALGSGVKYGPEVALAPVAVTAAIFHLFTHAFFKALLFLSAGSVMHAMGGVIDMRRISGLRKVLPITHWTFLCGAAALAGVPFLTRFLEQRRHPRGDVRCQRLGVVQARSLRLAVGGRSRHRRP